MIQRATRIGATVVLGAALMFIPGRAEEKPSGSGSADKLRRLESVTWNPVTHELTWVVSDGEKTSGEYKAGRTNVYHIKLDQATMDFDGEHRAFSPQEAKTIHSLMDYISRYAVESTVWWEDGQGQKVDGKSGSPRIDKVETAPKAPDPPPPPPRSRVKLIKSEKL